MVKRMGGRTPYFGDYAPFGQEVNASCNYEW
jgi:hypothetical protein